MTLSDGGAGRGDDASDRASAGTCRFDPVLVCAVGPPRLVSPGCGSGPQRWQPVAGKRARAERPEECGTMAPQRRAAVGLWAALTFSSAVLVHGVVHAIGAQAFVWDSPAHAVMLVAALGLLAGVATPLGLVGPAGERRRRLALVRAGLTSLGPSLAGVGLVTQAGIAALLLLAEGASLEPERLVLALACGLVALLASAFVFRVSRDRVVALLVALAAATGPSVPRTVLLRNLRRTARPAVLYRLFVLNRPPRRSLPDRLVAPLARLNARHSKRRESCSAVIFAASRSARSPSYSFSSSRARPARSPNPAPPSSPAPSPPRTSPSRARRSAHRFEPHVRARTDARGVFTIAAVPIGSTSRGERAAGQRLAAGRCGGRRREPRHRALRAQRDRPNLGHRSAAGARFGNRSEPQRRGAHPLAGRRQPAEPLDPAPRRRPRREGSSTSTATTATSTTSSTGCRCRRSSTASSAASSTPTTSRSSRRCKARIPRSTASVRLGHQHQHAQGAGPPASSATSTRARMRASTRRAITRRSGRGRSSRHSAISAAIAASIRRIRLAAQRVQRRQSVPPLHLPAGPNFFNLTVSRSYQTYQIPNDVANGQPAKTDDNETQKTSSARCSSVTRSAIMGRSRSDRRTSARGSGTSATRATISPSAKPLNPGAPSDCANALASNGPVVNGIVTRPSRTPRSIRQRDVRVLAEGRPRRDRCRRQPRLREPQRQHVVAFGGIYNATQVTKSYAVTLQPGNFLAPIFTPATPGAPFTVVDVRRTSVTWTRSTFRTPGRWARCGSSTTACATTRSPSGRPVLAGFGQLSPRVKLTRFFGARNSIYAYFGRFFTPFSLENVSPLAA